MIDTEKIAHDLAIAKVTVMLNQYRTFHQSDIADDKIFQQQEIQLSIQMIELYKKCFNEFKILCDEKI